MMINVILYDDKSIVRIAQRAVEYFSSYGEYRATRDTIWLKGMYIKFAPRMLILNVFDSNRFSENDITECLKNILLGEEVYVFDNCQLQKYIGEVNALTDFKVASYGDCLCE